MSNPTIDDIRRTLRDRAPAFASDLAPIFARNGHEWAFRGVPTEADILKTLEMLIAGLKDDGRPFFYCGTGGLHVQYARWGDGKAEGLMTYSPPGGVVHMWKFEAAEGGDPS